MVLRITDAACEFRYGYVPQWESGLAAAPRQRAQQSKVARTPPTGFGISIVSARYRQPALTDEPVEGRLHCRSNAHIDVVDARIVAEAGDDIDRLKDLRDDGVATHPPRRRAAQDPASKFCRDGHGRTPAPSTRRCQLPGLSQ